MSCLTSSYCFCDVQLFINPNPNPETAFFQKHKPQPWPHSLLTPFKFVPFFMHTHPTPLPIPSLFLGILLFDAFENVYYFLLHIMMSAAIIICHFNCVCLEKYRHLEEGTFCFLFAPHPPPLPPLPPSLPQGEFLKSGAKILLGPFGPAFFWHPFEIAFILLRNIYLRTKDSDEIIPPFALLSPNLQYRRSAWISSFRTENFLKIIGIDGVNRRFAAKQYVAPKNRTMLREQPIR